MCSGASDRTEVGIERKEFGKWEGPENYRLYENQRKKNFKKCCAELWIGSLFSSRYVKKGGSLILPPKLCVNFIISRHLAFAWFFSRVNHALIFACRFQSTIDFFFFLLLLYLLDMIVKLNFGTQRGLRENSPHSVFRNCTLRYFLKVQKIGRNDETNIT